MFKNLLVPLDGSPISETALSYAVYLAEKLGATLTLIHIIEADAPKEVHKQRHLTLPDEALAYLEETARVFVPPGVTYTVHVHTEEVRHVARSIVDHVGEFSPDLIVMCTHGHGGPRDWILGSIAQQVISFGKTPVLLIPPGCTQKMEGEFCQALVPMDGVAGHDQGLDTALEFAQFCDISIHLLMVIPNPANLKGEEAATGRMLPGATAVMLEMAEQSGKEYLARHLIRLRELKVRTAAEVARGDPVAAILSTARRLDSDIIILGTHGKTGMDAFWSGSVTPRLSGQSPIPLLLVSVKETG